MDGKNKTTDLLLCIFLGFFGAREYSKKEYELTFFIDTDDTIKSNCSVDGVEVDVFRKIQSDDDYSYAQKCHYSYFAILPEGKYQVRLNKKALDLIGTNLTSSAKLNIYENKFVRYAFGDVKREYKFGDESLTVADDIDDNTVFYYRADKKISTTIFRSDDSKEIIVVPDNSIVELYFDNDGTCEFEFFKIKEEK